jgi:magnesium and cobalt transporter
MRPPYFIPETKKISEVLKDLRDNKSHMAIVIDEYGGTAGILTLEDIIEEIIGEIMDEYDAEQKLIVEHEDGSISVNARLDVEKLEDFLKIELPEGDFESVGGFIISLIGKVPEPNEKIIYNDLEIVIEAATSRKIDRARISKLGSHAPEGPSGEGRDR